MVDWARDVIARQAQHMSRLVDDLLDVSRITRGTVTLQREPAALQTLVGRAIEMTRPLIDARRHALALAAPEAPLYVDADPVRLPQAIANVLNNAAKFTPEGGTIHVAVERHDREAVVRVRDDGIGIAPDLLPQIFDLFTQADRSPDRAHGGLGVGLTLVRRLVELHDGTVHAFSAGRGHGSEIVLGLPVRSAHRTEPVPAASPGTPVAPRRILVVDDDTDAAESLAMVLRIMGHEVDTAHSGPAALARAERGVPEVVLLDIGLPDMDGYEVARRFRRRFRESVLIAVTGYGRDDDRRRAREAGFDGYVVKPFDDEVLERVLRESSR
jgi:CheY-like chemotaxis protein